MKRGGQRSRAVLLGILLTSLAVLAVSCTENPVRKIKRPGLSLDQANKQTNKQTKQYINEAIRALPGQVEIANSSWNNEEPAGCDDPNNVHTDAVAASLDYMLSGINASQTTAVFASLRDWSKRNGFHIIQDKSNKSSAPVLIVGNKKNYRVSLKVSPRGEFSLGASSPCARPDSNTTTAGQ